MDRKRWTAVLIVVVVLLSLGIAGAVYYLFFSPETVSINGGEVPTAEQELEKSLPSLTIQREEEAAEVSAFYLDCKQNGFNKDTFIAQLESKATQFSKIRVSMGEQPDFSEVGKTKEVFTLAPDALVQIGEQFSLDPRVLATLIQLESRGLTNPAYHPRFPLLYPEVIVTFPATSVKRDEFQIQVGIASDTIAKAKEELQADPQLVEEQSVTSQAILKYWTQRGYTVARIEEFLRSSTEGTFVTVFRSFFETDPRVCRN